MLFMFSNHTTLHGLMEYGRRKMMVIIKAWSQTTEETHLILIEAPSKEIAVERFKTNIGWAEYRFQVIGAYCTEFKDDMVQFMIDNVPKKSTISKKIVCTDKGTFVMENVSIPCTFRFRDKCTTIYHIYPRKVWLDHKLYRKKNKDFFDQIDRIIHASIKTTRTVRKCICPSPGRLPIDTAVMTLTDVTYVIYEKELEHVMALIQDFYFRYNKTNVKRNINFFYCSRDGVVYSLLFDEESSAALTLEEVNPIFI